MSTTYEKIRAILAEAVKQESWSPQALKQKLIDRDVSRNESNFHILDRQTRSRQPISDKAIYQTFALMESLQLLVHDDQADYVVPGNVNALLAKDDRYRLLISNKVITLLDSYNATISDVRNASQSINYPQVRDARSILEILQRNGKATKLNGTKFSQLIFLLSSAGQRAERHMRIFYDFT